MKFNRLALVMAVAAFPVLSRAQDGAPAVAASGGTEAMGFVKVVRNPAAAGRGFAGSADPSAPAWASFRNPAVLPFSERRNDLALVYQNWAPGGAGSADFTVAYGRKFGERTGLSVGVVSLTGGKISLYNANGSFCGDFTPSDLQVNAGFGLGLGRLFAVGVNAKCLRKKVAEETAYTAFAADIFGQCRLEGLSLALGVSNIGTLVKGAHGGSFRLPASLALAADYRLAFADCHQFAADLDFDWFFSGNAGLAAGLEYGFREMLFVRGGYHFGTSEAVLPSFASAGLGVQVFGFRFDIACLFANEYLARTLTLGLGYSF